MCGATSEAGKSWVVAGLCRLLARRGVRVAPFKAQNMALNAAITSGGAEIGHAQWVQAVAAGAQPEVSMNPVLLKPTGERTSQVVVMGQPRGVFSAADYHALKVDLRRVVLDALADLRQRPPAPTSAGSARPASPTRWSHRAHRWWPSARASRWPGRGSTTHSASKGRQVP